MEISPQRVRILLNFHFCNSPSASQDCCIVYFTPANENGSAYSCYWPTAESGLSAVIYVSLGRKGQ
jgi:hypothetical protein